MNRSDAVSDFLAQKRIAIVGLSRRTSHTSRHVVKKLRMPGREIVGVNRAASEIECVPFYPDLKSIPGGVAAVMVVTRPNDAASVIRDFAELGITRVWLHRTFGTGSSSAEAIQVAQEHKITLIPAGCPLMYVEPVDPAHKCFRWCVRFIGRLPTEVGT